MGLKAAKCSRTVRNWYQDYRKERKIKVKLLPGKHNMPSFLQQNQDITVVIKQYLREHLHEPSVELLCEYIHDVVLPKLTKEATGAAPNNDRYSSDLKYGLKTISMSTVCCWMKCLGFKYEVRRKGYYIDGHKKPTTIEYRKQFVARYLTYERRAHRWIQINLNESAALENKGLVPKNSGYRYTSDKGDETVKYHVNACREFQKN
jgi:hypothetical protein